MASTVVSAARAPHIGPFTGPASVRLPHEWLALGLSCVALVIAAGIVKTVTQSDTLLKEVALLIVVGMLYVTLSRGRLLGGSIRVHAGQFGHVYEIVEECSRKMRMATPQVFVRDDPFVPIVGVGIGEPYAIIISAQWVDHLTPDEIRFLIGRELGHIGAGHTRISSLLSINGRENALIAIIFGPWLRRIEYTADRFGLLCCESVEAATCAIAVSTFHLVGRKIDLAAFAGQYREIAAERSLQMGEWVTATPYATNRIAALQRFSADPNFRYWSDAFNAAKREAVVLTPVTMQRKNYVGFFRRLAAYAIDLTLIDVLYPRDLVNAQIEKQTSDADDAASGVAIAKKVISDVGDDDDSPAPVPSAHPTPAPAASPHAVHAGHHLLTLPHTHVNVVAAPLQHAGGDVLGWLIFFAYAVLLVGVAGQTFGMMILGMRVVGTNMEPVGLGRALWRYGVFLLTLPYSIFRIFGRIQPFEKWSGTRLVTGNTLRAS
jgi:Zn-dependent protease with chaperone function